MSDSIKPQKPTYFFILAVAVFALGIYSSYENLGFSVAIIPSVILYMGIGLLFAEFATGNIAVVKLRKWRKAEIGAYGKLALLFMAVGGLVNSFVGG